ncbi:hypothetical protein L6452_25331 [Arctium lappa]|uniref:Uncharacterized protein n=1 Tax=Arctium lappa TaxID=4217 RepID=A0ACB9AA76_ARCLA|nr:hypothetical protein L6452_25331 [Arctium lappa]
MFFLLQNSFEVVCFFVLCCCKFGNIFLVCNMNIDCATDLLAGSTPWSGLTGILFEGVVSSYDSLLDKKYKEGDGDIDHYRWQSPEDMTKTIRDPTLPEKCCRFHQL